MIIETKRNMKCQRVTGGLAQAFSTVRLGSEKRQSVADSCGETRKNE